MDTLPIAPPRSKLPPKKRIIKKSQKKAQRKVDNCREMVAESMKAISEQTKCLENLAYNIQVELVMIRNRLWKLRGDFGMDSEDEDDEEEEEVKDEEGPIIIEEAKEDEEEPIGINNTIVITDEEEEVEY